MEVLHLNDDNFEAEVKNYKGTAIVDFFAEWCGPCKAMGPVFEDAAKEAGNEAKFAKLNVEEGVKTAQEFGVMSIPTIVIFKDGKEVERMMGIQDKSILVNKVKSLQSS